MSSLCVKRILVTGASGMLGATLVKRLMPNYIVFATDFDDYVKNITKNFKQFDLKHKDYSELVAWASPDLIIHCAALINGNYCEQNPSEAMEINGESVERLLRSAPYAKFIYISTDAVFPYGSHLAEEGSITKSESVYGRSKILGESFIEKSDSNACIVRTTIVGKNANPQKEGFAEWIVSALRAKTKITLFVDVLFTPISIWHFAEALEWVIKNDCPRKMHIAGSEIANKYGFGIKLAQALGLDTAMINKGSIVEFPSRAKRSTDQTLSTSLFSQLSGYRLPSIQDTIEILVSHFRRRYEEYY